MSQPQEVTKKSLTLPFFNFTYMFYVWKGILIAGNEPGNFQQELNDIPNPADYNVIWLDEDSAIEYDCYQSLVSEEYGVYFISRTPILNPDKLQATINFSGIEKELKDSYIYFTHTKTLVLIDFIVENLGLNPQGLQYTTILQEGCWSTLP